MIGEMINSGDLKSIEGVVKLFDRSKWRLINGTAKKFTTFFEKGKPIEVYYDELPVEEIFPHIRILFDKKDEVIAQRSGRKGHLRVCIQGNWQKRVKVDNHLRKKNISRDTSNKIYRHLRNLEII